MTIVEALSQVWGRITDPRAYPDDWDVLRPLHVTADGWLEGDGVEILKSDASWHYPKLSTPHGDPIAIVAHCSDTPLGTARTMAKNRMRPRTPQDRVASWHISVESDLIVQQISLEAGAWHAIGSIKGAGPANRVSNGIELVGYEKGPWPPAQVAQAARVWRAIVQSYGIKRELAMVPHAVIDPDRRKDPGALFMSECAPQVLAYAFA